MYDINCEAVSNGGLSSEVEMLICSLGIATGPLWQ
jgi:hypothetical protein